MLPRVELSSLPPTDNGTIDIHDDLLLRTTPLVSVNMLAYRHEKFIAQAIEGVIAQQCSFPIELIIGEDCSPDRTRDIALGYQQRFPHLIRILTAKRNVGMHANGARILNASRGQFVAYCEGDDYWHHPRKLQMQIELMAANPSMVACHTDFDRLTRFRVRRYCHRRHPSPWLAKGNAYNALLRKWSVMTATCMMKREIPQAFAKSPFVNPTWPFGDRNLLLFASLQGTWGYLDESTATFRKTYGSSSNSGARADLRMATSNLECIRLFLSKYPTDSKNARYAVAEMYNWIYRAAFRCGDMRAMNEAFSELSEMRLAKAPYTHQLHILVAKMKFPIFVREFFKKSIDRYLSAM